MFDNNKQLPFKPYQPRLITPADEFLMPWVSAAGVGPGADQEHDQNQEQNIV